jgi:predicted esterase
MNGWSSLARAMWSLGSSFLRRPSAQLLAGASLISTAGLALREHDTDETARSAGVALGEEADFAFDTTPLEWCAPGLERVEGNGCYAAPDRAQKEMLPLVIYLHGLFEKGQLESDERDRQRRLAQRATRQGFAVLALRGSEGACMLRTERSSFVCWPSNGDTAQRASSFVRSWQPALDAAAERHPISARYILGFSNGGYFASLLATRALFRADAFVIAHAGPVEPVVARGEKVPILLVSADDDLAQATMIRLDDALTELAWPHDHVARDGGHALSDTDIDVALTFLRRSGKEAVPLIPPLSTHVPRARLEAR